MNNVNAFKILALVLVTMFLILLGSVCLLAQEYVFSHATHSTYSQTEGCSIEQTVTEKVKIKLTRYTIAVTTPTSSWVDIIISRDIRVTDYCVVEEIYTDYSVYKFYFCDKELVGVDHIPPVGGYSKFHF